MNLKKVPDCVTLGVSGGEVVAAEPSNSQGKPVDMLAARNTCLSLGVVAAVMWLILGPNNPLVALTVTGSTANLGLAAIPLALRVPARWYHVPQWERQLHLLLGVPVFGWLLDHSGWNRTVALPMRQLKITKTTLPRLLENIHAAEGAHAIAFVPHAALAMLALATGYVAGALWLLLPGIILHFYPVMLQRWMTLRVAPLLRRPEFH
ncbi:MAG: hypothetical protein J7493_09570 [Porphyrobacter sp.]|nr:hypothetical protein [Porphyrobacter sp.]